MDNYQAATSWVIFSAAVGFGCWYYYPRQQRKPERSREETQHAAVGKRKRTPQDERGTPEIRPTTDRSRGRETLSNTAEAVKQPSGNDSLRKRKAPTSQPQPPPSVVVQSDEPEEEDTNTQRWAEGMMQTQKGFDIGKTTKRDTRLKTVKQSSALATPTLSGESSDAGAEADDNLSPVPSPSLPAGDVSDMLKPTASGPSTLRLTAPLKPQNEKVVRKPKEEVVETKKQRQNRKKVEEQRLQREADEQERRKLLENQRRTAREARGEPARNGIPQSKPPAVSAWAASPSKSNTPVAPTTNGTSHAPLLDTFDAESMSSSNGGPEHSTGPTSTTSGGAAQWGDELPSEEEQMAKAMKQSEDESGWTTVSQKPRNSRKNTDVSIAEPVLINKTNAQPAKLAVNGKPKGFQALEVEYEQRADADPNDASNWDA